jgi:hypothetical protein
VQRQRRAPPTTTNNNQHQRKEQLPGLRRGGPRGRPLCRLSMRLPRAPTRGAPTSSRQPHHRLRFARAAVHGNPPENTGAERENHGHGRGPAGIALRGELTCTEEVASLSPLKSPARFPGRAQFLSFNFPHKLICNRTSTGKSDGRASGSPPDFGGQDLAPSDDGSRRRAASLRGLSAADRRGGPCGRQIAVRRPPGAQG